MSDFLRILFGTFLGSAITAAINGLPFGLFLACAMLTCAAIVMHDYRRMSDRG